MIKNFGYSIFFKLLVTGVTLFSVPLLLSILGAEGYGLWVALSSLLVWMSMFDFGFGHALKNTITKAYSDGSFDEAKLEILQTLKLVLVISCFLFVLFIFGYQHIALFSENANVSFLLFVPTIIFFPFSIGVMILQGARRTYMQSALSSLGPIFFVISLLLLIRGEFNAGVTEVAFFYVVGASLATIMVWVVAIKDFRFTYIEFLRLFSVDIDYSRVFLGFRFFGLQLSALVLYSFGPYLVYNYIGAEEAAYFDIVNKLFLFGFSLFNIGMAVCWPEIMFYKSKNDYLKVLKIYKILLLVGLLFSFGAFLFTLLVPFVLKIWTGGAIVVLSYDHLLIFALLVSLQSFAYCGAVVLNAFEKVTVQLILSVFSTLAMLPLFFLFLKLDMSIASVPLASIFLTIIPAIYCNWHAYSLIRLKVSKND